MAKVIDAANVHPCYQFTTVNEEGIRRVYYGPSTGKKDRRLAERLVRAVRDRPLDAKLLADIESVHVVNDKEA